MKTQFSQLAAAGALLAMIASSFRAEAGLKTLKFEAQVAYLDGSWEATAYRPAPPISLHIGDLITGSFQFDPTMSAPSVNSHEIQINLAGFHLQVDGFDAYVMDDRRQHSAMCDCGYGGPVAPEPMLLNDEILADASSPVVDDRIEIAHYLFHSGSPDSQLPGHAGWRWQPAFSFAGPLTVLSTDDFLPADVAVWNAFTQKIFRFGLDTLAVAPLPDGGQQSFFNGVYANANITSLTVVPEPTSLGVATAFGAILAMQLRRRQLREPGRPRRNRHQIQHSHVSPV